MLKTNYMPGNKVICIQSFYTEGDRLIKLNTIGYVVNNSPDNDAVNVVWHTDEFPYTQQTDCSTSVLALSR